MTPALSIHADAEALARAAADWICQRLESTAGRLAVALSGGSTPKRLYETLASTEFRNRVPWARVHWFWGDERFVAPDHPQSNFAMFDQAVLRHVRVAKDNVHPVPILGHTPAEAAEAYSKELQRFHGVGELRDDKPLFNLVLLGLGNDGHVASLLPASPALEELSAWVTVAETDRTKQRITLTYPALESCGDCLFLITGTEKREVVSAVLRGEDSPATRLNPRGTCNWFIDRAAMPDEINVTEIPSD
jgi:6-phosphogluconolactonase|tara:strand:- start:1029 stop:1772 length:744 start_codon:yes stop_codon:yes gene_type:complete